MSHLLLRANVLAVSVDRVEYIPKHGWEVKHDVSQLASSLVAPAVACDVQRSNDIGSTKTKNRANRRLW